MIAHQAARTPQGQWISAWGYDPFHLAENRHPTRWDIDRAVPDHPVRLNHRSGHACVLNSVAMDRVGIFDDTDEPPGATIARDLDTGSPNGLLLEMQDFLDQRTPKPSDAELTPLVRKAAHKLLSSGVTSIQDATHTNSPGSMEPVPASCVRRSIAAQNHGDAWRRAHCWSSGMPGMHVRRRKRPASPGSRQDDGDGNLRNSDAFA